MNFASCSQVNRTQLVIVIITSLYGAHWLLIGGIYVSYWPAGAVLSVYDWLAFTNTHTCLWSDPSSTQHSWIWSRFLVPRCFMCKSTHILQMFHEWDPKCVAPHVHTQTKWGSCWPGLLLLISPAGQTGLTTVFTVKLWVFRLDLVLGLLAPCHHSLNTLGHGWLSWSDQCVSAKTSYNGTPQQTKNLHHGLYWHTDWQTFYISVH